MSFGTLPQHIDVQKWADREAVIEQINPLRAFARLVEGAVDDEGEVTVNVRLHRDAQGLFVVEGRLATAVKLTCQRCLEPVVTPLEADVHLWLLRSEEQADRLPDDADYLVLDDEGGIDLAAALEDELILALPLVPAHEVCETLQVESSDANEVTDAPARPNPFQVLASLKGQSGKE
ncbi:MAG TPA: YceD family protein [Moraxellaceae bacterium]|nr:YceD family protein [Moraxellaceae bacterium]